MGGGGLGASGVAVGGGLGARGVANAGGATFDLLERAGVRLWEATTDYKAKGNKLIQTQQFCNSNIVTASHCFSIKNITLITSRGKVNHIPIWKCQ